jgi:GTP-binding protein HflX
MDSSRIRRKDSYSKNVFSSSTSVLLLLLLPLSTNAFTIPTTRSRSCFTVPSSSALKAQTSSEEQQNENPPSLFVLNDETGSNDTSEKFQVQEIDDENLYNNDDGNDDEDLYDDDEDLYDDDEDLYNDEGQSYNLVYDNDVIDVQYSASQTSDDPNANFDRDYDDLQTEREDRLFVNEKGESTRQEKCILVAVEDVTAMRKNRYEARKKLNMMMEMGMEDDMSVSKNPEEWEVYFTLEESMNEMRDLIDTCGMELVGEVTQRLNDVNPRTYIGTGKVKETQLLLDELDACTVIFDAELSPGQQKSLENAFNKEVIQNDFLGNQMSTIKVIDRTALILDIFAQHAKTREGKLQVDLALHIFRKPRLTKMWTHLERQSGAGGVGLRGPGESQLEIDNRLLRDRIIVLKRKIDSVQKQRDIHRKGRSNLGLPVLALVGYTNAGKSTLLNYLTRAGVMAENILFATLDPTTRKVKLPGLKTHPEVLLTDTVGFIQKLPTQLVAAFRATLEEVKEADVLIHVMDASNPVWNKQELAVKRVLSEIDAGDQPVVRVLNKIDLLDDDVAEELQYEAAMMEDHSVAISSTTGEGMIDLVATIEEALMALLMPIEVLLPYTHGKEVNMVQEVGHVEEIDFRPEGTYIQARVPEAIANRLKSFSVNQEDIEQNEREEDEIDWVAIGRGRHPKSEL